MKDAYSFDVDGEGLEKSYKVMYDAYCKIFERCNLPYIPVLADPGVMGGNISHEFMVPSEIGEDKIVLCKCGYSASIQVAVCKEDQKRPKTGGQRPKTESMKEVETPGASTVADVSKLLKVKPSQLIKTLIYLADGKLVALLIRGDYEVNEVKLKNYLKVNTLEMADEDEIEKLTSGPIGYSGPVGLSKHIRILADYSIKGLKNAITGANRKEKHLLNVNIDRDFKVDEWLDTRFITAGDSCPACGEQIDIRSAIEIGHTFKLGVKYSTTLGANFLDKNGKSRPMIMGCYGIGVNRILAASIEVHNDKDGIIWPGSISPYEAVILPLNMKNPGLRALAEEVYKKATEAGIDIILDDRDERAGIKFKDSDLIGFPVQVIIGEKNLEKGKIELKKRKDKESTLADKKDIINLLTKYS